mmetsp:Transcript_13056/g.14942  ORF Transcript_13056/g.14942 Transcript_13056/m.14942 type:complete len:157 (+) Transcript_13056:106-576(+)|eukprot:CAMPEP_0194142662 /NCGR_PEP_ID=MMETSP0152-20130528/11893_1 /TAXON_ID=1049557 /ORGANISM="Thalassiothrix antarctica, Strain L6-D1" /LENGTH=156 /DNA_ID=CAMNT_0038841703 /DNA_START=26 /DNA_END=496 /DNA_ORIENTATION=-
MVFKKLRKRVSKLKHKDSTNLELKEESILNSSQQDENEKTFNKNSDKQSAIIETRDVIVSNDANGTKRMDEKDEIQNKQSTASAHASNFSMLTDDDDVTQSVVTTTEYDDAHDRYMCNTSLGNVSFDTSGDYTERTMSWDENCFASQETKFCGMVF